MINKINVDGVDHEIVSESAEKKIAENKEKLETLVVNDLTTGGADKALSAEMGKVLGERLTELESDLYGNIKTQLIQVNGQYIITPISLKAGFVISAMNYSVTGSVIWLAVGRSNKTKIEEDMLPYQLTEDYDGISSSAKDVIELAYTENGLPQYGDIGKLEKQINTNTNDINELKNTTKDLNSAVNGTIKEMKVVCEQGSYNFTQLPIPLKNGYIITGLYHPVQGAVVWLSKKGLGTNKKIDNLPMVLDNDYLFIAPSHAGEVIINYTEGENPEEGALKSIEELKEKVKDIYNECQLKRDAIYVYNTDSEIDVLEKMKMAFDKKNCDVFFQKGTYVIKEAYVYMYNQYHWTDKNGLPLGDGCRYYFNGSTIIGETPSTQVEAVLSCNILDSIRRASSYEVYDVTLINRSDLKVYCVHDEAEGSKIPYIRKYKNVRCVGNHRKFGCGTGFDAEIVFENCEFVETGDTKKVDTGNIAIHGVIASMNPNNEPQNLRVSLLNCYFNNNGIPVCINPDTFISNENEVELKLTGCKCGHDIDADTAGVLDTHISYNNDIVPYE